MCSKQKNASPPEGWLQPVASTLLSFTRWNFAARRIPTSGWRSPQENYTLPFAVFLRCAEHFARYSAQTNNAVATGLEMESKPVQLQPGTWVRSRVAKQVNIRRTPTLTTYATNSALSGANPQYQAKAAAEAYRVCLYCIANCSKKSYLGRLEVMAEACWCEQTVSQVVLRGASSPFGCVGAGPRLQERGPQSVPGRSAKGGISLDFNEGLVVPGMRSMKALIRRPNTRQCFFARSHQGSQFLDSCQGEGRSSARSGLNRGVTKVLESGSAIRN